MTDLKKIYVGVDKNSDQRRGFDLYPTPPIATYVLCKYAPPPHKVIEPCAGRGHISKELIRNGFEVKSYDLNDHEFKLIEDIKTGVDVLSHEANDEYGMVTNPPYFNDLPRKIAEMSIKNYRYSAMFVRLTFLEGIKRKELFTNNPPSDILIMSDRIKFADITHEPIEYSDQIGGMICYMWIVWDKSSNNKETKIHWISLKEEYQEWRKKYDASLNT